MAETSEEHASRFGAAPRKQRSICVACVSSSAKSGERIWQASQGTGHVKDENCPAEELTSQPLAVMVKYDYCHDDY